MKKIAIFLDGANVHYIQKKMGWYIDAEKLLNYCKEFGEVVEAIYYNGENDGGKQRGFLTKLSYIGYSLETKPVKTIRDYETGETITAHNLRTQAIPPRYHPIWFGLEDENRQDLYHRIGVILIKVPPLRERKGDVAILVNYFLESICREYNIPTKEIDAEAVAKLSDRRWSGNIRELRNIVERLVVLGGDTITREDIESYC